VMGRIDDAGGRIGDPSEARVALVSDGRGRVDDGRLVGGAFRFERVRPCRFRLALMEGDRELAHGDWLELAAGAVLDAGVLRTVPGGAVRVTVARAAGTERSEPAIVFRTPDALRGTKVALGEANELLVDGLTPGKHEVTAYAKGLARIETHVTVTAGATAALPLVLEPGCVCRVSVWLPDGVKPQRYRYALTGHDGRVLRERSGEVGTLPTRPFPVVVTVPLAACRLDFDADGRFTGSLSLHPKSTEDLEARLDAVAR
jgi:hypothetical protein